jgi:hypothetical protein
LELLDQDTSRAGRLALQLHSRLLRRERTLLLVAFEATSNEIHPRGQTTLTTRDHVVDGARSIVAVVILTDVTVAT